MKKIKLLLLTSVLDKRGAEKIILKLALGLDPDRYLVKVVCLRSRTPFVDEFRARGVEVILLGMERYFQFRPLWRLYTLLRREKPDLVHTHLYRDAVYARPLARLAGVRGVVSTLHNSYVWRSRPQLILDRLTSIFADRIAAVSDAVKKFAIEHEHIPAGKLVTVHNGIETGLFQLPPEEREAARRELGLNPDELAVGTMGELAEQKNHRCLLDAVPAVLKRRPQTRFLIAGDGELKEKLLARRDELGLGDRVRFLGYREDVPRLLSAFDIFVLPSLWEGLPVALIEAMAAGVPIVATDVDGNIEVFGHGEAGLAVPPGDPERLAEGLLELAGDPDRRKRLGETGRRRARELFDVRVMIRRYGELYQSCLR
jgi:L-malate glycosyltransferase